mmetsp:Transcript_15215/g.36839  ORF Transcript_15215/g.36839 Transcript_15215/m.36839 type:complete len:227 (+) Transcript_15215:567-1247(+)
MERLNSSACTHVSCEMALLCSAARKSHHSSTSAHRLVSSTFHIALAVSRGSDFWLSSLAKLKEYWYTSLNLLSSCSSARSAGSFALSFSMESAPILRIPPTNSSRVYFPMLCADIFSEITSITGSMGSISMSSQNCSMPAAPIMSSSSSSVLYFRNSASTSAGSVEDAAAAIGMVKNISKPTSRSHRASFKILNAISSVASATVANRRTLSFCARFNLFMTALAPW